jgi:hypothetical protein
MKRTLSGSSMRFVSFEQLDGLRFAIPVSLIFQIDTDSDGVVQIWFDDEDCVRVYGSLDEIVDRINALYVPTVKNHYPSAYYSLP